MHFSPFPVTAQKKDELDRSDVEFIKKVACPNLLSTSPFAIEHIVNYRDMAGFSRLTGEGFDDAVCSMPRTVVAPVPYNPPPLMYPCVRFGPPLHAPINWASIGLGKETVAWTPNINSMTYQFFPGYPPYTTLQRRRRLSAKKKKRALFSQHQVDTMENEFTKHRYITESKRAELSSQLDLTETQVKTWFQNRRTKWKNELKGKRSETHPKRQRTMSEKSSSHIELCLE